MNSAGSKETLCLLESQVKEQLGSKWNYWKLLYMEIWLCTLRNVTSSHWVNPFKGCPNKIVIGKVGEKLWEKEFLDLGGWNMGKGAYIVFRRLEDNELAPWIQKHQSAISMDRVHRHFIEKLLIL